ncbi:MAG TPA: dihydrolipoamide acetyltransferase family protein [Acidimicrobiia bacterium]|nr:dihydrolipoamide acetyltransferase family protein [Acidimicrobiia bacterium]
MRSPPAGFLSPVVRRLGAELGIDPSELSGTGRDGRVTRDDVVRAVAAREEAVSVDAPAAAPFVPRDVDSAPVEGELPFSKLRRQMATRLVAAKRSAAHAFCSAEVDVEAIERVRATHGPSFRAEEGFSLTYLPFFARATVDALLEFPYLNGTVAADELRVAGGVHLGIAVDLDGAGLLIPVVHDAQTKDLRILAREVVDLARRARSGELRPDDVSGGTFTVTNPGPFSTVMSVPIINAPQVGILATDAVRRIPVVVEGDGADGIAVRSIATIGLSFDHRAIDGAYAASFVRRIGEILSSRAWASEVAPSR